MKYSLALSAVALASSVAAQQTMWGQCGGNGWTGPTTCVAGSVCVYSNAWYSQCLAGTSTQSSTRSSTSSTKPPSSSTSKSSTSSTRSSTSSAPSVSGTKSVKTWFSFGDSYTQTGFTVNGVQPSLSNAFGNPSYPGYTACGSYQNWIDYAATVYNKTFVEVYNLAYGGATIDASLVTPYTSTVLSLVDQVNEFLNNDAPGKTYYCGWSSANTLFSVWIGINDIGNTYGSGGDRGAFDNTLLDRYFQLVQSLYNAGARHFLFLTVPPIDRSPLMLAQGTSATSLEKTVIADYNSKLSSRAAAFASSNSGATTLVYDTQPVINAVLNSPSSYGLVDNSSYGDGNTYAWCNNYHISPPVHNQVAKGVAALIAGTYI